MTPSGRKRQVAKILRISNQPRTVPTNNKLLERPRFRTSTPPFTNPVKSTLRLFQLLRITVIREPLIYPSKAPSMTDAVDSPIPIWYLGHHLPTPVGTSIEQTVDASVANNVRKLESRDGVVSGELNLLT